MRKRLSDSDSTLPPQRFTGLLDCSWIPPAQRPSCASLCRFPSTERPLIGGDPPLSLFPATWCASTSFSKPLQSSLATIWLGSRLGAASLGFRRPDVPLAGCFSHPRLPVLPLQAGLRCKSSCQDVKPVAYKQTSQALLLFAADIQYWGKDSLKIDGSHPTDDRSLTLQQHFDSLAELADQIFASTTHADVPTNVLRQAFSVCSTCYLSKPGLYSGTHCTKSLTCAALDILLSSMIRWHQHQENSQGDQAAQWPTQHCMHRHGQRMNLQQPLTACWRGLATACNNLHDWHVRADPQTIGGWLKLTSTWRMQAIGVMVSFIWMHTRTGKCFWRPFFQLFMPSVHRPRGCCGLASSHTPCDTSICLAVMASKCQVLR